MFVALVPGFGILAFVAGEELVWDLPALQPHATTSGLSKIRKTMIDASLI
jgi:hypothetical protein